jgi:general secretion pathway protein M
MASRPTTISNRSRVLVGVAAAVALAYLVLLHWWFTAPMLAMGDQIDDLRQKELELRMEAAQRPQIEQQLARVRKFEIDNPGFLPEANKDLASAGLVQRLEQVVGSASPNPNACQITARTPADMPTKEPFTRVVVQVRLRCGMGELATVLYSLESGSPQLFVDNLDMLSRRSYLPTNLDGEGGALDVSFDLYGYLKDSSPKGGAGG